MLRIAIAVGLFLLALIMITVSMLLPDTTDFKDLFLNLGSEIIGITITVAIVNWLIERSKMREEAQRIAWSMLHDIDHAVWVWQGGRREFHLDELVAILDLIEPTDRVMPFTQNLMANLGVRAADTLRLQSGLMRVHVRLKHAMTYLSGLGQIRELNTIATPSFIVDAIKSAITNLAHTTGQQIHTGQFGVARTFRDASPTAQESRYKGVDQDPIAASPLKDRRGPGSLQPPAPNPGKPPSTMDSGGGNSAGASSRTESGYTPPSSVPLRRSERERMQQQPPKDPPHDNPDRA